MANNWSEVKCCSCKTGEWRSSSILSVINHLQSRIIPACRLQFLIANGKKTQPPSVSNVNSQKNLFYAPSCLNKQLPNSSTPKWTRKRTPTIFRILSYCISHLAMPCNYSLISKVIDGYVILIIVTLKEKCNLLWICVITIPCHHLHLHLHPYTPTHLPLHPLPIHPPHLPPLHLLHLPPLHLAPLCPHDPHTR